MAHLERWAKMKTFITFLFVLLLGGCAAALRRDGSTRQLAIMVPATDFHEGREFEFQWLRLHVPDAKYAGNPGYLLLERNAGHEYDVFHVALKSGGERVVYFDATKFRPALSEPVPEDALVPPGSAALRP